MFLSLHFRFFVLGLVHQTSFTLVLCLSVLAESGGCTTIILLLYLIFISKNPKIFAYHHALHIAFCIVLALDLLWSPSQDFIQESQHVSFEQNYAFHVLAYPIFHGHNAFALIVRCPFCFMLCRNTISCTTIYLFLSNKGNYNQCLN